MFANKLRCPSRYMLHTQFLLGVTYNNIVSSAALQHVSLFRSGVPVQGLHLRHQYTTQPRGVVGKLCGCGYCDRKLCCKTCRKTYIKMTRKINNRILLVYMYGQWKIEFYWLPRLSFVAQVTVGVVYVLQHTAIKFQRGSQSLMHLSSIALDLLGWPVKCCLSFLLEEGEAFTPGSVLCSSMRVRPSGFVQDSAPSKLITDAAISSLIIHLLASQLFVTWT